MISLLLALTVGVLFAAGTYMILRRGQIKLILGLGLLSHGVNLLLFGSGTLTLGLPPIFQDKSNFAAELAANQLADPLPQALILTAIVISFGITAFVVVLVNRRQTITNTDVIQGELVDILRENDPFDYSERRDRLDPLAGSEYDWLAYELDEVYDRDKLPEGWAQPENSELDESAAMEKDEYQ